MKVKAQSADDLKRSTLVKLSRALLLLDVWQAEEYMNGRLTHEQDATVNRRIRELREAEEDIIAIFGA